MLPWTDTSLQTRIVGKFPAIMAVVCFVAAAYFLFLH